MRNCKINVWGRLFSLDVIYDCYPGEEVLDCQKDAADRIINASESINAAKPKVEEYILHHNKAEVAEDSIDNIFRYIIPKSLFVTRDEKNRTVAIMCNYKFDIEHGLAIVFINEKLTKIGPEDIIL